MQSENSFSAEMVFQNIIFHLERSTDYANWFASKKCQREYVQTWTNFINALCAGDKRFFRVCRRQGREVNNDR